MLDLNKLHKYLYFFSVAFVAFEVLGFSNGTLKFNFGPVSSEEAVRNAKYFTYLMLASVSVLYIMVFILSFKSYASKFLGLLETSRELTKIASEKVLKKTGKIYQVPKARPKGLFSPVVDLGRYHDVRGVLSPPIEFTVPFFVYLKIVLHSGFKALFTRGGVFEHFIPLLAFAIPVTIYLIKYGANAI